MTTPIPRIDRLIIAERSPLLSSGLASVIIGVVLDNGQIYWGDCLPVDGFDVASPTVRRLVDLCEKRLCGQPLAGFRHACQQVHPVFPAAGRMPLADSVKGALEQGVLAAVASTQGLTEHELLGREYELTTHMPGDDYAPSVIVEINDFEATPESIGRLFAIRPHGLGYRLTSELVAESIGSGAEYLIEFVGELTQLARKTHDIEAYNPVIYIGLDGALGRLTDSPVRDIGKILAICRKLEEMAGDCQLMLEDVFVLQDPSAQVATYGRLKKLMLRAPRPQGVKRALLVATGKTIKPDDIPTYLDVQAVDSILFEPLRSVGIDDTMTKYSLLKGSEEVKLTVSFNPPAGGYLTSNWVNTATDLLIAMSCQQILINYNSDTRVILDSINRHLLLSHLNSRG